MMTPPLKICWVEKAGSRTVKILQVNGEPWREVAASLFRTAAKFSPEYATQRDLEEAFLETEYTVAFPYALKRLSMKSHLSAEMERALSAKLVTPPTIQRILYKCQQLGYLDDQEWVKNFIIQQKARRVSPAMIVQKLRFKGIAQEISKPLVSQLVDRTSEEQQVLHLLTTKHRRCDFTDPAALKKVIASLLRKGFSYALVRQTISRFQSRGIPIPDTG